ncbi:hypothetical protein [Butyrivibrio sp. AE2032]|uniref:hypothetical protein n=1 Tax=Butyrivibrio sp. AE2032 TaxID=1458463 RepID=UPI0005573DEB|nr:hypothetical protein [Butyrivibrio sp. AE2032]
MIKNIREELLIRREVLSNSTVAAEKKIRKLPDGRVKVKRQGKYVYFYITEENRKERIAKKSDQEILEKLLQKNYLEQVLEVSKKEIAVLDLVLKKYPILVAEEIYGSLDDDRKKYIKPIVPTDEQFIERWQNEPYTPKPISDDVPKYKTKRGEWVRSKSEALIADRLFAAGIPYKYECPLTFKVDDRLVTIHPDFTILRVSDRKILYLEHCGKMGDPEYVEEMVNRVNDYIKGGIYQGDRLFFTFETSKTPLDLEVLDKMIEKNFR